MWLSGTTQSAIRAVLHVAEHGVEAPVRVDAIAAALEVPRNYLSKTLHQLVRAGVLHSVRGPRGGFQLAMPAAKLTLALVASPFDNIGGRECLLGKAACSWRAPCSAHPRWEAISTAMQAFFSKTTIADLLQEISDSPAMAPPRDAAGKARGAGARTRTRPPRSRSAR